mmetsp:Transcript_8690/g.19313  ORF Transcript_8690/g.19313 Transcript_8690/m.19313 type:complete len:259 (-) Transcript_8690:930-1706(-)
MSPCFPSRFFTAPLCAERSVCAASLSSLLARMSTTANTSGADIHALPMAVPDMGPKLLSDRRSDATLSFFPISWARGAPASSSSLLSRRSISVKALVVRKAVNRARAPSVPSAFFQSDRLSSVRFALIASPSSLPAEAHSPFARSWSSLSVLQGPSASQNDLKPAVLYSPTPCQFTAQSGLLVSTSREILAFRSSPPIASAAPTPSSLLLKSASMSVVFPLKLSQKAAAPASPSLLQSSERRVIGRFAASRLDTITAA